MFKRFLITLTITALALVALINIQVHLVNRSINKEVRTLAQTNSTLTEVRSLLKTIDDPKIHPLDKQSALDQATQKINDLKSPKSKPPFINPLNLKSINLANKRRDTLQEIEEQVPSLIQQTQEVSDTLSPLYNALHLYFEYHPSIDLNQRSINQNTDEFIDRLTRAQAGINKTLSNIDKIDPPNESKNIILTSINQVKTTLNKLVETTKNNNSQESDLLRDQFIQEFFDSQVIIDQTITNLEPRKTIINISKNLSKQIDQALHAQ